MYVWSDLDPSVSIVDIKTTIYLLKYQSQRVSALQKMSLLYKAKYFSNPIKIFPISEYISKRENYQSRHKTRKEIRLENSNNKQPKRCKSIMHTSQLNTHTYRQQISEIALQFSLFWGANSRTSINAAVHISRLQLV